MRRSKCTLKTVLKNSSVNLRPSFGEFQLYDKVHFCIKSKVEPRRGKEDNEKSKRDTQDPRSIEERIQSTTNIKHRAGTSQRRETGKAARIREN